MSRYANQSHLSQEVGPTVRPLQGLPANKHGSSWRMIQQAAGTRDDFKSLVDVRSETNDAEMLTVTVGVVATENPNAFIVGGGFADLIGRVSWGIGGASFEAFIDMQNGLTFSLPANFLRVDVAYRGDPPGAGTATVYQISAGVGYGTYAFNSSPTRRTVLTGLLGVGGLVDIPIPPFAVSYNLYFAKAVPIGSTLEGMALRGAITTQTYVYFQDNRGAQAENAFPIQNGAPLLEITNPNAFPTRAGVIFNLSI